MDKPVKCALIGTGYWGSKLQRYLEQNRNFDLTYVCNSKSDLNQVWTDKSVTAVVVATPNATHYELVKSALLHGKHVLSEKPLALRANQCEELQKLAEERNLLILVEYTYNFSKALKKAVEWVEQGKIGTLLSAEMCVRHLGRFQGGSVYWLLASHMLAVLDMFVPLQDLKFRRKDLVVYDGTPETGIVEFDGSVCGQIVVSLNYGGKEVQIVLYGENGTIIYNPLIQPVLRVVTYKRLKWTVASELPKKEETLVRDEGNNLQYAIEAFYDVLRGAAKTNLGSAVEISRILESIQN